MNLLIASPLFGVLKEGARRRIRGVAEGRGVPWQARVAELERSAVFRIKEELEDRGLRYPAYYTRAFHGGLPHALRGR